MRVEPVLHVDDLAKTFGSFKALDGVDIDLRPGEVLGLVGPNGSGKTTVINLVSGVYTPTRGKVVLAGKRIDGHRSHVVSRAGLNRTFQIPKPFKGLTVAENIRVAAIHRCQTSPARDLDPLEFVGLSGLEGHLAGSLTAGQQKMLDLARALASGPKVLLVDELGAGLNPSELGTVAVLLRKLADRGVALLVVEHLMGFLEAVTDEVLVLNAGKPIFSGDLRSAVSDIKVVEVFLGKQHDKEGVA